MLNQVTTKHIEGSFQLTLALGNFYFSFRILLRVCLVSYLEETERRINDFNMILPLELFLS
jgi:hypothetical protein